MISLQEKVIEELKAYKQSIITEAVTKGLNPNVAMRDSGVAWIGEIPEYWELRRAKSMFKQSTSKGNDRLVLLSATQNRGVVDKSTLDSVVQVSENADLSTFKTVHKNDFVISLRSFQGGFEISHEEGVISPAYTVFRLSTQTYPHYYRHLFKSYGFIDKINSLTVGIREGKNIQYVDFADMLLPYIPLAEQQKIAEFLDRKCDEIDRLIEIKGKKIEELKEYKKSLIYEYVTGKKEI
jgi:type I restriction enzyme S subunit